MSSYQPQLPRCCLGPTKKFTFFFFSFLFFPPQCEAIFISPMFFLSKTKLVAQLHLQFSMGQYCTDVSILLEQLLIIVILTIQLSGQCIGLSTQKICRQRSYAVEVHKGNDLHLEIPGPPHGSAWNNLQANQFQDQRIGQQIANT